MINITKRLFPYSCCLRATHNIQDVPIDVSTYHSMNIHFSTQCLRSIHLCVHPFSLPLSLARYVFRKGIKRIENKSRSRWLLLTMLTSVLLLGNSHHYCNINKSLSSFSKHQKIMSGRCWHALEYFLTFSLYGMPTSSSSSSWQPATNSDVRWWKGWFFSAHKRDVGKMEAKGFSIFLTL